MGRLTEHSGPVLAGRRVIAVDQPLRDIHPRERAMLDVPEREFTDCRSADYDTHSMSGPIRDSFRMRFAGLSSVPIPGQPQPVAAICRRQWSGRAGRVGFGSGFAAAKRSSFPTGRPRRDLHRAVVPTERIACLPAQFPLPGQNGRRTAAGARLYAALAMLPVGRRTIDRHEKGRTCLG